MRDVGPIDASQFVARVKPSLQAKDWDQLVKTLNAHWTPSQIVTLLTHPEADTRKVAALCAGLVGDHCCLPELTQSLHDTDPMVVEMAEHSMWQIWFRDGTPEANKHLARGAEALNRQDVEPAIEHLDKAIALCPNFAEAYNQRAIAHYLAERFPESIADCRIVVKLMPIHFGAWAGMGHAHLALTEAAEALSAYEHALAINPHLECVAELVQELRAHH
ncbi:MAG: tetratricopeptide repeat protein [Tepidisphaeraceae bacterium]